MGYAEVDEILRTRLIKSEVDVEFVPFIGVMHTLNLIRLN